MWKLVDFGRGELKVVSTSSSNTAKIYITYNATWWHMELTLDLSGKSGQYRYLGIWVPAYNKSTLDDILDIFDSEDWQNNPWAWIIVFISGFNERYIKKHVLHDKIFNYNTQNHQVWLKDAEKELNEIFKAGYYSFRRSEDDYHKRIMVEAAKHLIHMVPESLKPPLRKILSQSVITELG